MADADPRGSSARTPRWVKVSAIIAFVLVALVAVMLLVGGGDHGPGRHMSDGGAGGQPAPSGAPASGGVGGHTPPAGRHTP